MFQPGDGVGHGRGVDHEPLAHLAHGQGSPAAEGQQAQRLVGGEGQAVRLSVSSTRLSSNCWTLITEVTAAMRSACSGQRALHCRCASAIRSKGSGSGTLPTVNDESPATTSAGRPGRDGPAGTPRPGRLLTTNEFYFSVQILAVQN